MTIKDKLDIAAQAPVKLKEALIKPKSIPQQLNKALIKLQKDADKVREVLKKITGESMVIRNLTYCLDDFEIISEDIRKRLKTSNEEVS